MRVAISEDGKSVGEVKKFNTPDKFEEVFKYFSEYKEYSFEAVAGGIAAIFDRDRSTVLRAPNLPGWEGKQVMAEFQDYFGSKVYLENDANLAGLGEAGLGAGRDYRIVVYITVSTGIGGARIVDKKIDAYTWGFEPGHQIIDADVTIWPESKNFDPESLTPGSNSGYISGAALASRYGLPASGIKDPAVWNEVEKLLAVSLYNTTLHWSPEIIILGGGMILEDAISVERTQEHLKSLMKIFPEIPEIRKAELGDTSALHGALILLNDK